MGPFKVGDRVRFSYINASEEDCLKEYLGTEAIVTEVMGESLRIDREIWRCHTLCARHFEIINGSGKRGRKVKVKPALKEFNWTILKDSCNNHEATFTTSEEGARNKLGALGVGYTLYKLSKGFLRFNLVPEYLVKRKKTKVKKKVLFKEVK